MATRMSHSHKTWGFDDERLMNLYGLSHFHPENAHPVFGSAIQLQLSDGSGETIRRVKYDEEGNSIYITETKTELMPPTLLNLSGHFGYTRWAVDNVKNLAHQSQGKVGGKDLDPRLILAVQEFARNDFFANMVYPARQALLKQGLYFYCIPATSIETELITGRLIQPVGSRVLCILPKSHQVARYYGISEEETQLLAGQVIWLICLRCNFRSIRIPLQLIDALDGWSKDLDPGVMKKVRDKIQQINPFLVTSESLRALLP